MIKAVFFDIDGTLLSHRTGQIPPSSKKAIRLLREKGIKTFIATGRHRSEIAVLPLQDLEFDGYVTLNGQYCYSRKPVLYDLPFDVLDIKALLLDLQRQHYPCMFVEADRMYINFINQRVQQVQDSISTPLPDLGDLTRGLTHNIYQIIPYVSPELENHIISLMPHCKPTRWHDLAIDIIPAGGGKQNGIRQILRCFSIAREEIMVFGDGENDQDMMEFADYAIAMGNAVPSIKALASYVTDDIDNDGVYRALLHYQMI